MVYIIALQADIITIRSVILRWDGTDEKLIPIEQLKAMVSYFYDYLGYEIDNTVNQIMDVSKFIRAAMAADLREDILDIVCNFHPDSFLIKAFTAVILKTDY